MHVTFRRIITLVVLIILLLWISSAWAVTRYRLQPIELPEVPECGAVRENAPKPILNNQGQVAGSLKSCAFFWDQGKVTVLGEQSSSVGTQVASINNIGQVVFNSTAYDATGNPQNTYAYLWDKGAIQDLGALGAALDAQRSTTATDINASGQVVGHSNVYDANGKAVSHAFLWQDNHIVDLVAGTVYANQSNFFAPAINDHAQVVFNSAVIRPDTITVPSPMRDVVSNSLSIFLPDSLESSRPLLWRSGVLTELAYKTFFMSQPGGEGSFSFKGVDYGNIKTLNVNILFFGYAYAINNAGIILGSIRDYSLSEDGSYYLTALWNLDGSLRTIEGARPRFKFSTDAKINNQNQVMLAQSFATPADYSNRILLSNGGDPYNDIGGGRWSGPIITLFDINDQGQVVWTRQFVDSAYPPTYRRYENAFIYQDNIIFNLNDLMPADANWHIERVYAINNAGQILVGGAKGYALLSPVTKPSCDANQDGKIDKSDLSLIYAANRTANPAYDLDGDGVVSVRDVRQCVLQCGK